MSQNPPLSVSGDYPGQNYQQPPIGASPDYPQHGQNYDNVDQNQRTWNQSLPSRPFNIPVVPLKVIVLVDFLLVVWAAEYPWLPASYLWANFMVITMGIWSIIDEKTPDGPHMMLLTLMATILQDIIMIAVRYGPIAFGTIGPPSEFRFSAGMAILNLILKPFYGILIYSHLSARGGTLFSAIIQRKSYESIDGPQPQATPAAGPSSLPATSASPNYQDTYSPYSQHHDSPALPQYPAETKSPVA